MRGDDTEQCERGSPEAGDEARREAVGDLVEGRDGPVGSQRAHRVEERRGRQQERDEGQQRGAGAACARYIAFPEKDDAILIGERRDGIEDFGYGKGYTYLAEEFSRFLQSLEGLRESGMHLVMVAHSTIRKFEQPDAAGAYDRYELKLSKQCAPLLKEWCDLLLFVNYFTKVTEKDGKQKAVGGKERRIYTSHCAAFDAKNRHDLEDVLPMAFESLAHVIPATTEKPGKAKSAKTPPAEPALPAEPGKPVTEQQLKNIATLWKQLGYGQAEMTKLFQWLEAEALDGAETWQDLNQEQAARAIAFLCKKTGKEVAASSTWERTWRRSARGTEYPCRSTSRSDSASASCSEQAASS